MLNRNIWYLLLIFAFSVTTAFAQGTDTRAGNSPESATVLKALSVPVSKATLAGTAPKASEGNTAPKSNKTSGIRSINFFNYSYRTSVCPDMPETIKLRNGKFKMDDMTVHLNKDEVVYGDVNMDGREDAVIQLRCSTGASFRSFDIQVYTFQKGRAELLATLDMGVVSADYGNAYPDSIMCCAGNAPKIRNGHLIVEALTDGLLLNPENTTTFDYQLSGDHFVLIGKPTKKKRDDARLSPRTQTIEQLAKSVARTWDKGNLASLDAGRPYMGSVEVGIEGSLGEPPSVSSKTFRTLAQVGRWFGKERAEGPGRNVGPLQQCSEGVCTFDIVGMNHNNLFLQKITYGMSKGKPYLKAIHILSGD